MYYIFFIFSVLQIFSAPPVIPDSHVNSLAGQPILRTTPEGISWVMWIDESTVKYSTAYSETSFSLPLTLHQGGVDCFNSYFDAKGNILCIYSAGSSLFYHYGNPLEKFPFSQSKLQLSLPCSIVYDSRMQFCEALQKFILFLNTDAGIYLYYFDNTFSSPNFIYKNQTANPKQQVPINWVNFTTDKTGGILLNWIDLNLRFGSSNTISPFTLKWTYINQNNSITIKGKSFSDSNMAYITQPAVFYNQSNINHPWTITFTQNYWPASSSSPKILGFLIDNQLDPTNPQIISESINGTAGKYVVTQRKDDELIVLYSHENKPYAAFFDPSKLGNSTPQLYTAKIADNNISSYLWKAIISIQKEELYFIYYDETILSYSLLPANSKNFINFSPHRLNASISNPTINGTANGNYYSRFIWLNNKQAIQSNPGTSKIFKFTPVFTQR